MKSFTNVEKCRAEFDAIPEEQGAKLRKRPVIYDNMTQQRNMTITQASSGTTSQTKADPAVDLSRTAAVSLTLPVHWQVRRSTANKLLQEDFSTIN